MLISEFAIAAGLSRDTIRFYVRLGLLQPQTTAKGGRRPYQLFSAEDVQAARIIRIAQSLGMSLKEIAGTAKARREGCMTRERSVEVLRGQLDLLEKSTAIKGNGRILARYHLGGERGNRINGRFRPLSVRCTP